MTQRPRRPTSKKSATPEQDKYPPNGGSRREFVRYQEEQPEYEPREPYPNSDEEFVDDPEPPAPRKSATRRRTPRTTKSNPKHVILPWNDVSVEGWVAGDPEFVENQDGDVWLAKFSISIYQGKNRDGGYRPRAYMQLTFRGEELIERVDREIHDRDTVIVKGHLEQSKSTTSGRYFTSIACDYLEIK